MTLPTLTFMLRRLPNDVENKPCGKNVDNGLLDPIFKEPRTGPLAPSSQRITLGTEDEMM